MFAFAAIDFETTGAVPARPTAAWRGPHPATRGRCIAALRTAAWWGELSERAAALRTAAWWGELSERAAEWQD